MIGDKKTGRQTAINNKKAMMDYIREKEIPLAIAGNLCCIEILCASFIMVMDYLFGTVNMIWPIMTGAGGVLLLIILLLYELKIRIKASQLGIKDN